MRDTMSSGRVERITLQVPSDLRYGEAVRSMLDALTKRLENETKTEGLNHHVISAFSEAFNNVVWHAYGGKRTEPVGVEVEISDSQIKLSLSDQGVRFDISSVEDPDLPSMPEGGLGLWIIRSLMTEVEYVQGEKNVLTMCKNFDQPLAFVDDLQEEV